MTIIDIPDIDPKDFDREHKERIKLLAQTIRSNVPTWSQVPITSRKVVIDAIKQSPNKTYKSIANTLGCDPSLVGLVAHKLLGHPKRRGPGIPHWSKQKRV